MVQIKLPALRPTTLLIGTAAVLAACGGGGGGAFVLPPATTQAQPGKLLYCDDLAAKAARPGTVYTSVAPMAAGALTVAGISTQVPAHCLVKGKMNERTGPVDGQTYAIGFEMRLPVDWNGRFFYQANGGLDGSVVTATGGVGGGGPLSTALHMGFAVISSDAGHSAPTPSFGLDPQARVDYGYNAVAQLTPMAKNLITKAYGRGPDRSYLGGCSNGGRHAMVAASRYADQYDGFLAGDPGFNLPKAAVAQLYGVQQYATVATGLTAQGKPDLQTAFTPAELNTVAKAVAARCDALDGLTDGIVSDIPKCRAAFNLATDVPSCSGARDGACLTDAQKTALSNVFAGARNSAGTAIYSTFPFDAGISGANWRQWKFANSQVLDTGAVGFVFSTPPLGPNRPSGIDFALTFNMDTDAPSIYAASGVYAESSMSFMTPPNPTQMKTLRERGSKLLVYHGTSDPVFSSDDTTNWYEGLRANNGGDASAFARYFPVPGMNHCAGGPATDQFDMLSPLVAWVEQGKAPVSVKATARGAGANVVNAEIPAGWSASRTRPLCPYPQVAAYTGSNPEDAASFTCK